ncbi:MAG TPA: SpoIIE family protein phosphatase [Nocardioides sp.]|nr:SpoIIE family protein phosphatase [Nocardioides sp.]
MTVEQSICWPADPRLLDAFDAAALLVDPEGHIVHANEAAERLFGRAGASLVGESLLGRLFCESEQVALATVGRQVLDGVSWHGRLDITDATGSRRGADVTCSPLRRDQDVVGLICVVATTSGDQIAETRLLAERLTRLARVTTELVMADNVDAVTKIVISHAADAAGATIASLTLREGDEHLQLVGLRGGREGDEQQWARRPLSIATPISDAIRTGESVVVSGAAAIEERYPLLADPTRGERSLIALPLNVSTRCVGAIGLSFPGLRTLDSAELDFFEILADSCAQALERIEAQSVAAQQTARLVFLADASTELASSLDYQSTLAKVARLAVPSLADWCAIDVVDDGRLRRLAVEHVDPAKVQLAQDLAERYPTDPDASTGAWHVMRTGESELYAVITDEMILAGAKDEEHLRIMRDLHLRSALTVPLVARGRVLGVITWVSAESERTYTADDLALAEDLAKRAAIAIDNSELHSETLAAAIELQHSVLPQVMPTVEGWDVAHHYSPSGRTEVGGDFYDAIPLADGRMVVFVGDVMGRGVTAAAAMAQMRSAVRAYAAVDPTPAVVMRKLDLMFTQYPSDQLVTLVYLVVDPTRDEIVVSNAGHPPPVLLRADGATEQLPLAEGCPLGVVPQKRTQLRVPFRAGDTVLAFTDGLIERRDEDIDQGQARILRELASLAQPVLAAGLTEIVTRLHDTLRDDDIAALAARRTT